jgi:hypothetical protein
VQNFREVSETFENRMVLHAKSVFHEQFLISMIACEICAQHFCAVTNATANPRFIEDIHNCSCRVGDFYAILAPPNRFCPKHFLGRDDLQEKAVLLDLDGAMSNPPLCDDNNVSEQLFGKAPMFRRGPPS